MTPPHVLEANYLEVMWSARTGPLVCRRGIEPNLRGDGTAADRECESVV